MEQIIKYLGVGRKSNPSEVLDGRPVEAFMDKVGRQAVILYQVRDLVATASATLTTGTSTSLLAAGGTGVFHDLLQVTFSNNSTVSAQVSLKDDGTAYNFQVPASGAVVIRYNAPLKQSAANSQWNADMEDITGTTVYVEALFAKNS